MITTSVFNFTADIHCNCTMHVNSAKALFKALGA